MGLARSFSVALSFLVSVGELGFLSHPACLVRCVFVLLCFCAVYFYFWFCVFVLGGLDG